MAFTDGDCVVDKKWLKNLTSAFESEDVAGVVGFCKTPREVNFLQKLIGIELENRFKNFPRYISRGPTMNLCVRTGMAKKLKFNEKLDVSYDTDFGYRLTGMGKKIVYEPSAIIYHYHRATWENLFRQQMTYGKFMPLLYLRHKRKVTGDHISKPSMIVQPFILGFIVLSLLLSLFSNPFMTITVLLIVLLFLIYLSDFIQLRTRGVFSPVHADIFDQDHCPVCRIVDRLKEADFQVKQ